MIRLATADAIVRYLIAQKSVMPNGSIAPLFPGVIAIFCHRNITFLGCTLKQHQD